MFFPFNKIYHFWELYTVYFDHIHTSPPPPPTSPLPVAYLLPSVSSLLQNSISNNRYQCTSMLFMCSWMCAFCWSQGWLPGTTKRHRFYSLTTPQLRDGVLCSPPLSTLGLFGLSLSRSCICCHNCCELLCATFLSVSGKHGFLAIVHHLWLSQSFLLLFHDDPSSLGGGAGIEVLVRPGHYTLSARVGSVFTSSAA